MHTIRDAMARGELDEEEAYFVLRFAGHLGYARAMRRLDGPLRTARKWLVWVGGWEHATLRVWDEGVPAWEPRDERGWCSPLPLSFLGHRLTINGTGRGKWVDLRIAGGYLHVRLDRRAVYWSPNGTPQHPDVIHFVGRPARDE